MSQPAPAPSWREPKDDVFANLSESELFWQTRFPFLESHGYLLRPRHRPGWIPSWWRAPGVKILQAEDRLGDRPFKPQVIDARRMSDDKLVMIKKIVTGSSEEELATLLSSTDLRQDPRNHCVPILDVLRDPEDAQLSYLVMPFLRPLDDPEYSTIDEILDCIEQILEGLLFLHDHGIAHRDCAYPNVMLDAEAMFPQGFHPMAEIALPDRITRPAPYLSRSHVHAKYYFIDFGISSRFTAQDEDRLVLGEDCIDPKVPELSDTVPYDPFKVDVFLAGNMFYKCFLQKYSNVGMLEPLVRWMRRSDPSRRPSASQAFWAFRSIRRKMWRVHRIDLGATLTPIEEFWKARQSFFVEHGYTLRPRFRPGWVPSWRRDPTIDFLNAEDFQSFHALRPHLMDARRLSDNKLVLLKRVRKDSSELEIAKYLWSEELRNDPRNHSVPLLDVIPGFGDEPFCYLVMPFYRYIEDPPMVTVENVLDCCEQLLEGLVFMHEHGVAHRDCAYKNIMYDPDVLYPQGFHPMRLDRLPYQTDAWAPVLSRRDVQVRYYYIDFGISSHFAPDDPNKLVTGLDGIEQLVPELSDEVPYDPFKVDIFILGRMMYETFMKKFTNVGMIAPLVQEMTASDPMNRPNAVDALQRFRGIRQRVSALQASWRLRPVAEPLTITAVLDTVSLVSRTPPSISNNDPMFVPPGHYSIQIHFLKLRYRTLMTCRYP
ncbi:hypothetical protein FKP32DRAFT_1571909 [Trametes sanguinea]|nr:hypothetical protein FKP32DRAFT_1571909 [Trametes sanguinea]